MAAKTTNMSIIKQVILRHCDGESNRSIAKALSISKNTVNRYVSLANADKLSLKELVALDDVELDFRFNGGSPAYTDSRFDDFVKRLPYLQEQMRMKHMTLQLLWEEYRREVPDGYGLSQFRFHYRQGTVALKPSTVLKDLHQGGDMLYIDFAGDKMSYIDRDTGEEVKVQVFVAVLPASDYAFAMAVPSQSVEDFCYAVDCCLQHLGGVPRRLVPDNLKAAVVKANRYDPTINTTFQQLANHYGSIVCPTRVRHPKDKALVENAVKLMYRRVYAPLRKRTFYDIESLNTAISELVAAHNAKRVQTAEYSRQERFAAVDKPNLAPLPHDRFELTRTSTIKVENSGFIYLGRDHHHYSVPYQYIGQRATVSYTNTLVKVYFDGECIATHKRSHKSGYTYLPEHLASHSNAYRSRSPQYYIDRALRLSPEFGRAIELLFSGKAAPELFYRSADGLFSLQRSTNQGIFLAACVQAIERNKVSYSYITALCKKLSICPTKSDEDKYYDMPQHENIRGASEFK